MISVVKYFRRNHFSEKMIFSKIFFGIWLARKILQRRKMEFGNRCQNPTTFGRDAGFRQARFKPNSPESGIIRLDSSQISA